MAVPAEAHLPGATPEIGRLSGRWLLERDAIETENASARLGRRALFGSRPQ